MRSAQFEMDSARFNSLREHIKFLICPRQNTSKIVWTFFILQSLAWVNRGCLSCSLWLHFRDAQAKKGFSHKRPCFLLLILSWGRLVGFRTSSQTISCNLTSKIRGKNAWPHAKFKDNNSLGVILRNMRESQYVWHYCELHKARAKMEFEIKYQISPWICAEASFLQHEMVCCVEIPHMLHLWSKHLEGSYFREYVNYIDLLNSTVVDEWFVLKRDCECTNELQLCRTR